MSVGADRIRQHIVALGLREAGDYAVLAVALQGFVWPDGGGDRRHADVQGWFDRYMNLRGPEVSVVVRSCGCAGGRCLVCN